MNARIAFTLVLLAVAVTSLAEQSRPNILIILTDDLGYGDVGCYNPGSRIATPHLDALAREGIRFADAHAPAALCTPTRYGIITGRYPWRGPWRSGVAKDGDPCLMMA